MNDIYQRLLKFTHDAVYSYRVDDGSIIMANRGFVKILDLDCRPEKLVGRRLRDVLRYVENEGLVRSEILKTGEIHGYEYHFQTLKGEDRWVIHDSCLVTDPATGDRIVEAIAKDITERKLAEEEIRRHRLHLEELVKERTAELEAANKDLESFAFSVSHDLRAPLRAIDGFSQVILEDHSAALDEAGRNALDRIRAAAQRMGALIDDILRLSRVGRAEMRYAPVNLSKMAKDIAARLRAEYPKRRMLFRIQRGLSCRGDQRLLEIAISNLLDNAVKFTGRKKAARIEFGARKEGGRTIYFIRDNGVGFDMRYTQNLFGVFQRMHKESDFPGTGAGLAIVQRIIRRHGGNVWAEAETGRGATFFFTLQNNRQRRHHEKPSKNSPGGRQPRRRRAHPKGV